MDVGKYELYVSVCVYVYMCEKHVRAKTYYINVYTSTVCTYIYIYLLYILYIDMLNTSVSIWHNSDTYSGWARIA